MITLILLTLRHTTWPPIPYRPDAIAPARLKALPYAVQCIACALQAEGKHR